MRLQLGKVKIENISFSKKTYIKNKTLYINREELSNYLQEDKNIQKVDLELARPGESVRIIPIKDVVEPRVKIAGEGQLFPGYLGGVETIGEGITHILDGCGVMATGRKIRPSEGLVDMSGPAASYTTFSKLNNVVILITPVDKLDNNKYEQTLRTAGFRAAAYLGKAAAEIEPDEKEIFEYDPIAEAVLKYPDLPRIIYVCMLATYSTIYGLDVRGVLPTIVSPLEVIDGILVGGLLSGACHRDTTYHHSRNPVIFELLRRHGKDLCFLGVILTNQLHVLIGKERSSFFVSQIAKSVGAQGAIITKDGAGNPDTDLMLNCRNLEKSGIKTVLITDEVCGRDGASLGLADAAHEANATISTGNVNELLALPPMERVIGFLETVEGISGGFHGSLHEDGSLTVETGAILGSLCQLGFEKITTKVK